MTPKPPPGTTPRLAEIALDCAGLAGAGLITWGGYMIYHPAGLIVGGAFLLGGAVLATRKG